MNIKKLKSPKAIPLIKALSLIIFVSSLNACVQNNKPVHHPPAAKTDTVAINRSAGALIDSGYKFLHKVGPPQKLDTAIIYFDKAIAIDSSRFLPFQLSVEALRMQGNAKLAIKPLSRWINSHPNDMEVRVNRGILYEHLGLKEEANQDFSKISELIENKNITINPNLSPKDQELLFSYASMYFFINKKDAGIALLKQLENAFPNDQKIKNALAKINSEGRNTVIKKMFNY